MRKIGDEVYIQRGEDWSLDFDVKTSKGHPFMLLKAWQNPYLAITIAAALYEQKGDYRETHWLDLNERWQEQADGSIVLVPVKKFIATEPLFVERFDIDYILEKYGVAAGGKVVIDEESDFDITNFLFYTDPLRDGNYVYKYLDDENWINYNFRIVKQFDTKDWMEQGYLFDAKILSGESLDELIRGTLSAEEQSYSSEVWSDEETQGYINMIRDEQIKAEAQYLFDEGIPLRDTYDTKSLIIEPTRLYVSVNIQGGVGK